MISTLRYPTLFFRSSEYAARSKPPLGLARATFSGMRSKPLSGIRVLDLTRLLPGPMATLHLADMGADVIKIEDTGSGDYAREMGRTREGMSDFFRLVNRNKRAVRLDLKQPQGREVFLRLAKGADVVVEGFRPGVMAKLGLGYAALAAVNPRLVYCSITGYGQDGPYADRAGHDINYIGYAGVGDQIGTAGAPVVPNFQIADLLGGGLAGWRWGRSSENSGKRCAIYSDAPN